MLDPLVEECDRAVLELKIALELLAHGLADPQLADRLEIRDALEKQDPRDHLIGVLHLVDRLVAQLARQPLVAPVLAHLGVHEVLVDRRELLAKRLVQFRDDLIVATHRLPPRRSVRLQADDCRPAKAGRYDC